MLRLLMLSVALSVSSAAAQAAVASGNPLAVEPPMPIVIHHGVPQQMIGEQQVRSFDVMEIQPDGDTCFKIRTYVFSTGPAPKLLRETTCGPKRGALKSIEGTGPRLLPLDAIGRPSTRMDSPR